MKCQNDRVNWGKIEKEDQKQFYKGRAATKKFRIGRSFLYTGLKGI